MKPCALSRKCIELGLNPPKLVWPVSCFFQCRAPSTVRKTTNRPPPGDWLTIGNGLAIGDVGENPVVGKSNAHPTDGDMKSYVTKSVVPSSCGLMPGDALFAVGLRVKCR